MDIEFNKKNILNWDKSALIYKRIFNYLFILLLVIYILINMVSIELIFPKNSSIYYYLLDNNNHDII